MITSHGLRMASAGGNLPVQVISTGGASASTITITVPAHNNGDILLVMTANQTLTPPALLSGYTSLLTGDSTGAAANRAYRIQYKVSNGTTTSFNNTTTTYTSYTLLRNVGSIGVTNNRFVATNASTLTIPDMVGLNTSGLGAVVAGSYFTNLASAISPYTLPSPAVVVHALQNTLSSITGRTMTFNGSTIAMTWAVELLP